MTLTFNIHTRCGPARTGTLHTAHGDIRTPAFMPVGTAATVKAMLPESVAATGADIILGNTYHLMLRPGSEIIAELGGLHHFMHWDKPILTDSGGFQVMSLSKIRKIKEDGVTFQSHLDGKEYHLTPERSMEIQYQLGSDITMIFDECTPYPASHEEAKASMELSLRWAKRSREAYDKLKKEQEARLVNRASPEPVRSTSPIAKDSSPEQGQFNNAYGLFGIVQGSTYKDLRLESATALNDMEFDGMAIGGLAVGEGQEVMFDVLDYTMPALPEEKPRYLMGVGKPSDIVGAVMRGVDMFDCVIPTRSGRTGQAFTRQGTINIRNAQYITDQEPLDPACACPACTHHSKAYLNHLVRSNEILGAMLMTWHNLQYYQDLMKDIRAAIEGGTLKALWDEISLPLLAGEG